MLDKPILGTIDFRSKRIAVFGYARNVPQTPPHITDSDRVFAQNVKRARLAADLRQDELAAILETRGFSFHPTVIGKVERGERRVSIGEAAAMADSLGVALADLIEESGELQAAYAAHTTSQKRFVTAAYDYASSLLDVAAAADGAGSLDDRDRWWLDTELRNQSPARMTTDSLFVLRGAIDRRDIDPNGVYVRRLLSALEQDSIALGQHGDD